MKKSTLETIRNYLNGDDTVDLSVLRDEINTEYERITAKSRANAALYEAATDVVLSVMSTSPMTAKEIFAACEDKLPDGFNVSKASYLLRHQLADKVIRHDNGKNPLTYSRK